MYAGLECHDLIGRPGWLVLRRPGPTYRRAREQLSELAHGTLDRSGPAGEIPARSSVYRYVQLTRPGNDPDAGSDPGVGRNWQRSVRPIFDGSIPDVAILPSDAPIPGAGDDSVLGDPANRVRPNSAQEGGQSEPAWDETAGLAGLRRSRSGPFDSVQYAIITL